MVHIENDVKLDFKDVLIRPKRSTLRSRVEVELKRQFRFRNSGMEYEGVPIIAANMDTTGTFEIARVFAAHGLFVTVHKHYSAEQWRAFITENPEIIHNVAASSGTSESDYERLKQILAIEVPVPSSASAGKREVVAVRYLCLDVANGYSEHFVDFVRKVRRDFPTHTIIAGNVVTGEMTEELILSGADIIKVGIGPGSVCTTRKQTGVGYPQLSAVIECADAAHGLGGHIIADGGVACPGDFAKAFGAGADFVMAGGMFAGHDESGGELVEREGGKRFKLFYGMSSDTAMRKYVGKVAEYRSSEGKTVEVPYRGPIESTVLDVLGGLRSACTYVGAGKLKELSRRTTFIRVTQQLNPVYATNTEHAAQIRTASASDPKRQRTE